MDTLTNDEFAARVLELAKTPTEFVPTAYYDPDGDCIEFLAAPDNFHAERIDDRMTVYRSEETGEVIGSLLKGVTLFWAALQARLPGFKIEIEHDRVKLVHILRARMWAFGLQDDTLATLMYRKLISVAAATGVEVELRKAA